MEDGMDPIHMQEPLTTKQIIYQNVCSAEYEMHDFLKNIN